VTPYRLLITGSRDWTDDRAITERLDNVYMSLSARKQLIVVHGACQTGADKIAADWVEWRWWNTVIPASILDQDPHPADWDRLGKAAGPIRNQQMVDAGADLCLAFPLNTSPGTSDCIKRARTAGIPTLIFRSTQIALRTTNTPGDPK